MGSWKWLDMSGWLAGNVLGVKIRGFFEQGWWLQIKGFNQCLTRPSRCMQMYFPEFFLLSGIQHILKSADFQSADFHPWKTRRFT